MEMTNKEAIETIKVNYPPENYSMLCEALDMAMTILKEQEPVTPLTVDAWPYTIKVCGNCHSILMYKSKYCPECGRAVKWDG